MRSRRLLGLKAKKDRNEFSLSEDQQSLAADDREKHKQINQWIQLQKIDAHDSECEGHHSQFLEVPSKKDQRHKRSNSTPKTSKPQSAADLKRSKSGTGERKSRGSYNNHNFDIKEEKSSLTLSVPQDRITLPHTKSVSTSPNHPTLRRLAKHSTEIAEAVTNTNKSTQTIDCDQAVAELPDKHSVPGTRSLSVFELQCNHCGGVSHTTPPPEKLSSATLEDIHIFLLGQETLLNSVNELQNHTEHFEDDDDSLPIVGEFCYFVGRVEIID